MRVIGLTGGIGSGKSTVAGFLAKLGAFVIDLDKLGHEAIRPGTETWERIVSSFGRNVLNVNDEIDRRKLAAIVFDSPEALTRLNRIVHPAIDAMVNSRLEDYRRQGVEVVVLEAAAMIEAERTGQIDELWVTVAPEETTLNRLSGRPGYSREVSKARMRAQLSNEERVKHADVVIDTDCPLDELKARVVVQWHRLLTRIKDTSDQTEQE